MPKNGKPGRGWRTPAKHELLNKIVGHIAGAATTERIGANRFIAYDLCAGDGIPEDGFDFWNGTSPGILIGHAINAGRKPHMAPSLIVLYEVKPATFGRLIESLTANFQATSHIEADRVRFDHPAATVVAFCDSGHNAEVGYVNPNSCVFINHDPNAITEWAMRATMSGEVLKATWMCTTFNTLGCNPSGIKRLGWEEERKGWYDHLGSLAKYLPQYSDLVLAAIERDAAQWAYAITAPKKWRATVEKDIHAAFRKIGRTMNVVWLRLDLIKFNKLVDVLFKTRGERSE